MKIRIKICHNMFNDTIVYFKAETEKELGDSGRDLIVVFGDAFTEVYNDRLQKYFNNKI